MVMFEPVPDSPLSDKGVSRPGTSAFPPWLRSDAIILAEIVVVALR
jgi:hypothetical protein